MAEICVKDLKKQFGDVTVVDIPELNINKGDFLGIVGNNGAGKTTFFRLMLDLARADNGSISLAGIDPSKSEAWKTTTGACLNEGFLIDFLTPEEYFDFIFKINSIPSDEAKDRLAFFDSFMNGEIIGKGKLIREFSSGNKQKIGIVGAMLNSPKILILDEPFNFLDPSSQNSLKQLLTDYHSTTGATILVSSHNLHHISEISSRIIVMEKGRIVKDITNLGEQTEKELEDYFA